MVLARFPKTPHLYTSRKTDRDRVLSLEESEVFLRGHVVVQEKLDGTCIGFSFDSQANVVIQNKSNRIALTGDKNHKKLDAWCAHYAEDLFAVCGNEFVLFGEWLYWKHSVAYTRLPSFFMAHDLYSVQNGYFLPTTELEKRLSATQLCRNPPIFTGTVGSLDALRNLCGQSQYGDEAMEGVYIRSDDNLRNTTRCKFVSRQFTDGISTHWRRMPRVPNHATSNAESEWK